VNSVSSSKISPQVIPLWPAGAPGSESWDWQEEESAFPNHGDRVVHNVVQPTLTVYLPDPAIADGTSVIVCPGGGFHYLEIQKEGTDMARWLNARGIAAFILKYRLLHTGDDFLHEVLVNLAHPTRMAELMPPLVPLIVADGLQSIRLVRQRAAEWGILPNRIGIMGFSAGGMVTANTALLYDAESRPDFAAPIYGAAPEGAPVPPDAPPIFIACADDDGLVTESIRMYTAWNAAGRSAEMHIYSKGAHGFGLKTHHLPVDTWTDRFADWLKVTLQL
jgi:acetyl esterase/lipase